MEIKIEEVKEDDETEKVFFENPYEPNDEFIEDINIISEEKQEEQEVKPKPVEDKPNKVLNYFK